MEVIAQTFPLRSSLTLKLTVDGLISELVPLGDGVGVFSPCCSDALHVAQM